MDTGKRAAASQWMGQTIHNLQDEKLGELTDIVFDAVSGQIIYGVLSVGGLLGVGEKLFAVPWSLLRRDGVDESHIRLDASLDRLKTAPGLDRDNLPDHADMGFVERSHTSYS